MKAQAQRRKVEGGFLSIPLPCVSVCFVLRILLLWGIAVGGHPVEAQQRFEYTHRQMGTSFRIVLYAESEKQAHVASQAAFARIDSLNQSLSDYLPESELNRLSASAQVGQFQPVRDDLFRVLETAMGISEVSNGAFDITVGPLVQQWRRYRRKHRLTPPDSVAKAMQSVGFRHVRLDRVNCRLALNKEGMRLDLGGIAKGFAVDEALAVLISHGIHAALVDGGGDIVLGAAPPGQTGWRISLEEVDEEGMVRQEILDLAHTAIATSGDTYRYLEVGGVRYSHILDPRSGQALTHQRKVTVIAPTGMLADAWASVLSVASIEQAQKLLEFRSWCRARLIGLDETGLHQLDLGRIK